METRANNIAIGAFVLAVIAAVFIFIFWLMSASESGNRRDVKIVFPGAVTGLPTGGQVLFNGIKIGDVANLTFDPNDPKLVVATVRVDAKAPLRKDTQASLGFTGLTGVAYVDLHGGSQSAPPLIDPDSNAVPVIYANRSQFEDLLEGAKDILEKADTTLGSIQQVVTTSSPDIEKTIQNVEKFTTALANNSEGVDQFMAGMTDTAKALTDLSGRIGNLVDRGEQLLAQVPPEKIGEIVGDVEQITTELANSAQDVSGVVDAAKTTAAELQQFAEGLNGSLDQVDKILQAVEPDKVQSVLTGASDFARVLSDRSQDIDQMVVSANHVLQDAETVSAEIAARKDDIGKMVDNASGALAEVNRAAAEAGRVLAAVDSDRVSNIVASTDKVIGNFAGQEAQINEAIGSINTAAGNVNQITVDLQKRVPDVDKMISEGTEIASNLNAASVRVNGILDKVDSMVSADGQGFIQEATAAATSIRIVADAFAQRAEPISQNLLKLTQQGSTDLSATVRQLNATLLQIQRAVDNFDKNPNRVIFGGSETPVYNGARRR
ncbi:MlaD family protein [Pseudovibrio exalbescens]|uniref:MlaD family protein n=1 Tax=Pseudovibrio exalbescens TaxID=197461 RepID=UPI00236649B6|nr:MlaD family protein [Pseudovibrio exalbescens]MDD7910408.1 MlaD family protein [Pseudovibrio exalbescens]